MPSARRRFGLSLGILLLLGAHASAEAAAPPTASVITAPVAATAATEATAPAGAGLSVAASPCSEDLGSTIGAQRAVMMDTDRRESERRAAAAAVPHCRDDRLVELWIEALDDPVLLPFAVRGLARQANARSEEAVLRVLREPRSRVRALINLEAAATITSVPWMVRWATDATLPQPLRTDLRPALYRVARVNDFPRHLLPPRPVRWVGPAAGGAAVGALGFSLLGTVNGNARVALAAGVPIGAAVGGGAAAAWAYFSEQPADTALRLGTYPLWGGGWMLGWASTIEPLTLDNARRAVGLSLLGAGAGFAGAILDRPEAVSPARQALVDFGLGAGGLGGLSLAHLAFPTASDVGRWSAISVGGVAGGLLGALHARGGSATRVDRVALSAWPLLAMGSFRLFQSAATTATMTARERWILWVAPTDTDQAAWTGLGLAAGTYGALIVVGLNTGAPGEYLDREILPIASGGLYGATLLPLAAAAVKPNDIPEIWSGLGLHLGLATSLAVGGFADLDGVAASTGLVGGAWFGAAAIGVELLLPPGASTRMARLALGSSAVGMGLGWIWGDDIDWTTADALAGGLGAGWGAWQGFAGANWTVDQIGRRNGAMLLGASLTSAAAVGLSRTLDADFADVGGVAGMAGAGAVWPWILEGLVPSQSLSPVLWVVIPDVLVGAAVGSLAAPSIDGRMLGLTGAGAVLGSVVGLGISGATSASRADQSVAAMIGWVGGAAAGVTTDLVIDRLSRQRAPDPVAGARTTGDWAFLGVSALDMTERGGRGAVPGVELRWLQRPPVGVASRLN